MKLPIVSTTIVALAVALMLGLGIWQLDRRGEKLAQIERYRAAGSLPPIAYPRPPVGAQHLFRRATAFCLSPVDWQTSAGRTRDGKSGWRTIAVCRGGGLEGPAVLIELGVASDPGFRPAWRGGEVAGTITAAPENRPLIATLFAKAQPTPLMLVADTPPAPGLQASQRPDPASVPNNHLVYAVQWFLFAGIAVAIYLLALRRRQRGAAGTS